MPEPSIFVGRENQLSRLERLLANTLAGRGSICFITGNAGSGKTALLGRFIQHALSENEELISAVGSADATTGACDAYLPFREILTQLTGDVEIKLSQGAINQENANRLRKLVGLSGEAIAELGPDLIGIFIPGAGLVARAAAFAADKAGWLDKLTKTTNKTVVSKKPSELEITQAHIFEQYTNVLNMLARKHPLVLAIDDLHWADTASCELFFHLVRRIQNQRILILGTYRPDEVALGRNGERHPLDKVINELKRYYGDIFIELDLVPTKESHEFVNAFIDSEGNLLDEGFRQSLINLTSGHPLFTIELLRNMQERGDLVKDPSNRWIVSPALNWNDLPVRVDGVIEERLNRLVDDLRQALSIGSVEGETFTAEIIARIQKGDFREMIRRFSAELEKKHRLVSSQGVQPVLSGRISLYRFQHNLFQRYLYNDLNESERAYLHEDVGRVMEELFAEDTDRVAVQLAHHFNCAGLPEKALPYLFQAGEQAAARFANQEALSYFCQAISLTSQDNLDLQYKLHLGCEHIYNLLGERQKQKQELDLLLTLCNLLKDPVRECDLYLRVAGYQESIGEYPLAIEYAEKSVLCAGSNNNLAAEARAHHKWGYIQMRQGKYQEALFHLDRALSLSLTAGEESVGAGVLREMGIIYWRQGDYPKAVTSLTQSLEISRKMFDQHGEGKVLSALGNVFLRQGLFDQAKTHYQQSLKLDQQAGDKRGEMANLGNLGIIAAMEGYFSTAFTRFNQILNITREINDRESEARALGNLGSLMMDPGYYSEAEQFFTKALDIFNSIGSQSGCCWILADRGLSRQRLYQLDQALNDCNSALEIAQKIGNKHFQNTALTHRAHVELKQEKFSEARVDYEKSLSVNLELDNLTGELEALAGLATLSQMEGNLDQTIVLVDKIWEKFDPKQFRDSESRSHVLLTCYLGFKNAGDPREAQVLHKAFDLIMQQAKKFENEGNRQSFLQNIDSNRQILALMKSTGKTHLGE